MEKDEIVQFITHNEGVEYIIDETQYVKNNTYHCIPWREIETPEKIAENKRILREKKLNRIFKMEK